MSKINFDHERLKNLMLKTLMDKGVSASSAKHVCSSLIQSSLRGVDSHGIQLFPHYCHVVDTGRINKNPDFIIKKTGASTATFDADAAFGHHAGAEAMNCAIDMALQAGVGAVNVSNSSHFGAAAYFGLMAADKGCLGFSFTNADALVKAHGAKSAFAGTNPICFTAPMESESHFCLDMATSLVSYNKIKNYMRNKEEIPLGWGCDEQGESTTDPFSVRSLEPSGAYKGFGLGIMVEILCGILANGPYGPHIIPMYTNFEKQRYVSHFFMAIDISRFVNLDIFKGIMQNVAKEVRMMQAIDEKVPVMIAGDPQKKTCAERTKSGIPVDTNLLKEFVEIDEEFRSVVK